jgi:hypothetical protein
MPAVVESGELSRNATGTDGATARARPVPASTTAVAMKRYFALM